MSDLGKRIKYLMELRGLTQHDLAEACGVSQVAISRIINGFIKKPRILPELASVLGMSTDELIGKEPKTPPPSEEEWTRLKALSMQLSTDELKDLTDFAKNLIKNREIKNRHNIK